MKDPKKPVKSSHWKQDARLSDECGQLLGPLATLPRDKMAAWQCFWVCPRCGNPKAWKFKEAGRGWLECGQCEYYEEVL